MNDWLTVARLGELAPGDIKAITIGERALILCRDGDDYYCVQRACLHQGGDLADGLISRGALICPLHAWRFALATGQHELSPETCLRTHEVRIAGDQIQVAERPRPLPAPSW